MNKDDKERLMKAIGREFDDAPEEQRKMADIMAQVSMAIDAAYRIDRGLASKMIGGVIAAAFLGFGDDVDEALALNGKLYADIREALEKIDRVLSK